MAWLGLRHKGVEVLYPEEWNKVVDGLDLLKQYTDASLRREELLKLESDIIPAQDSVYSLGELDRRWESVFASYGYFTNDILVQGKPVLKDGDPVLVKEFIDKAREDIERIYSLDVESKREIEEIYLLGLETRRRVEEVYSLSIESKREIEEVYLVTSEVKRRVEEVYSLLSEAKTRIEEIYELARPPEEIDTWCLTVSTTPIPLSEVEMRVKRIHVKVPTWNPYLVYLGNSSRQEFPLEPGDKEVLEVSNPKKIYVRSLGTATVYVMVER